LLPLALWPQRLLQSSHDNRVLSHLSKSEEMLSSQATSDSTSEVLLISQVHKTVLRCCNYDANITQVVPLMQQTLSSILMA
jgi:DNA polymerase III sliding clamp (beta) subunit (PCNA family)